MKMFTSLIHSWWECKYHLVWIPKYRKKAIHGRLCKYLAQVFKELARARDCEVLKGHLMSDHVHMLISIPPKYFVARVIRFIKDKSAIHISPNHMGHTRNFTGQQFWVRGYHVSTVGHDEEANRQYIRSQEQEDRRVDQLYLFK